MKLLTTFVLLIMLLQAGLAVAQDSERTSYFPYQTGDFWVNEVYEMNMYSKDERVDVIADSVNLLGEIIYTVSSTRSRPNEHIYHIKIDSLGNIYSDWWYDKGDWLKIFDTSKNVGEAWILEKDSLDEQLTQYELAEVMEEYRIKVFGDSTTVKEVRFARTDNDSTSTEQGYGRLYVWWSEKFGILELTGLELPIYQPRLKGLMLGDKVYGDTTFVPVTIELEPKTDGHPQSFDIRNYPNPFNNSTNFVIETVTPDRFTLGVYDRLGRKVTEVFNSKEFASGRHTIPWQAGNLATGLYFVRLSSKGVVQIQTITYLK
ncbi:MAG: T9SS type A sorting domain-containing protein [Balneolaceae bacterium]|nr:T9SS type A sorting domain-containing protein [Balneolaceae bacterium]